MPGLNGKLSEVGALLGSLCLERYEAVMQRRVSLAERYRTELSMLRSGQSGRRINLSLRCFRQASTGLRSLRHWQRGGSLSGPTSARISNNRITLRNMQSAATCP